MSEEDMGLEIMTVDAQTVEHIERANIDIQIATAHRYPRSIDKFKKRAYEMVTMDQETAESCATGFRHSSGSFRCHCNSGLSAACRGTPRACPSFPGPG